MRLFSFLLFAFFYLSALRSFLNSASIILPGCMNHLARYCKHSFSARLKFSDIQFSSFCEKILCLDKLFRKRDIT